MSEVDLISVLTNDHDGMRQLLTELEHLSEGEPLWRSLADLLITEMVRHSVAEETYLYPVVRERLPDGPRIVDLEVGDHYKVERLLTRLERPDLTHEEATRLMAQISVDLRRHMRIEEDALFASLAEHVSEEERAVLGRRAVEAQEKVPTRRYFSAPDRSPPPAVIPPGPGLVERLHGYLRGIYPF